MSQTNVPVGSPLARKVFGAALFARTQRQPSLMNNLTGPAPQQAAAEAKLKGRPAPTCPWSASPICRSPRATRLAST